MPDATNRNTREVLEMLEIFSALKNPRLNITAQEVANIYNMVAKYKDGEVVRFSGELDNGTTFTLDKDGILKVKSGFPIRHTQGSHKFLKLAGQDRVFDEFILAGVLYPNAKDSDYKLYQAEHDKAVILNKYAKDMFEDVIES